jgi:plastocyanin
MKMMGARPFASLALAVGGVAAAGVIALAGVPPFRIAIESGAPYFLPKAAVVISSSIPIRWDNTTGTMHTITHDTCDAGTGCMFDSGVVLPDGSYELPGLPPGDYAYFCRLHPIMRGIVAVKGPETSS